MVHQPLEPDDSAIHLTFVLVFVKVFFFFEETFLLKVCRFATSIECSFMFMTSCSDIFFLVLPNSEHLHALF